MPAGLGFFFRRARRAIIPRVQHSRSSSRIQLKHIKIDDEEQLRDDDRSASYRTPGTPSIHRMKMVLLVILLLISFLLLLGYNVYKPSRPVISFLRWKYPDVAFAIPLPSSQKVVALTLDDAPSDETGTILDLLKTHGAKATFFVIGNQIASHPELLQRMHDEGHEIGNHAWKDEASRELPLTELERQIKEVDALIPANTNGAKYFRPGSGFFNKKMLNMIKSLGYRTVLGSIYPHDPQIHNPKINSRHVLSMLKPGGIIIMHDRRSYSAEQLELVLKGMEAKGWRAVSFGGLLRIAEDFKEKKSG